MGTYYYIVCHDCKVEQAAASTSCGNSPGGLGNSGTHLLPFIVEHAEGPHEDYLRYEVKAEWRERVAGPDPAGAQLKLAGE